MQHVASKDHGVRQQHVDRRDAHPDMEIAKVIMAKQNQTQHDQNLAGDGNGFRGDDIAALICCLGIAFANLIDVFKGRQNRQQIQQPIARTALQQVHVFGLAGGFELQHLVRISRTFNVDFSGTVSGNVGQHKHQQTQSNKDHSANREIWFQHGSAHEQRIDQHPHHDQTANAKHPEEAESLPRQSGFHEPK